MRHSGLDKGRAVTGRARASRGIQHARRIFSTHALRAGFSTLAVSSLRTRFAQDSARSPNVLCARASRGIQHGRRMFSAHALRTGSNHFAGEEGQRGKKAGVLASDYIIKFISFAIPAGSPRSHLDGA